MAEDQVKAASALASRFDAGLLDKARRSLDDARYAYRAGAIAHVDLLDALRTYGSVRADALTAAHDLAVSLYALERALGREIAR